MNSAQINNDLMTLANFYGAIASTPGITSQITDFAQVRLIRVLEALDKGTNHLLAAASGIIIES